MDSGLEIIDVEEMEKKDKAQRKKIIYISCMIGLAVLVAFFSVAYNMTRGVKVYTTKIMPNNITSQISTVGTVRSGSEQVFRAFTQARVTALNVKAGDTVNQGDMLALFSSADIDADVASKKYQAETAAAVVEKGKNNIKLLNTTINQLEQEISKLNKQLGVKAASAVGTQELQATALNYSGSANVMNIGISEELENMEGLDPQLKQLLIQLEDEMNAQIRAALAASESSAITPDELKNAIASALSGAESKLENALVSSDSNMRKQLQLALLKQQKNILFTQIPSNEEMNRLQAAADAANQAYQTAMAQAMELKAGWVAPFAGVVSEVNITANGIISAGEPGIVLVDPNNLVVDVELGKYDAGKVSAGQAVKIMVGNDAIDGTVSFVGSVALASKEEETPFVPCRIAVTGADERLIIGFDADVDIQTASAEAAMVLPITALRTDEFGKYCYRYNEDVRTVSEVYVETGILNEESCQIIGGLQFNDTIILNPPEQVYDGARVRVMDSEETTAHTGGMTTALYDRQQTTTEPSSAEETTADEFSYPGNEEQQNTASINL